LVSLRRNVDTRVQRRSLVSHRWCQRDGWYKPILQLLCVCAMLLRTVGLHLFRLLVTHQCRIRFDISPSYHSSVSPCCNLLGACSRQRGAWCQVGEGKCHSQENKSCADSSIQVAGGFTFALCLVAWYLLAGQILQSVDSVIVLPVGDLSTRVPSASGRALAKSGEV
jgi:hypothetical protein